MLIGVRLKDGMDVFGRVSLSYGDRHIQSLVHAQFQARSVLVEVVVGGTPFWLRYLKVIRGVQSYYTAHQVVKYRMDALLTL